MSDPNPTNAVLATKIDSLKELMEVKFDQADKHFIDNEKQHAATNTHLAKLNGQVTRNSNFRIRAIMFYSIVAFLIPLAVTVLINKYY